MENFLDQSHFAWVHEGILGDRSDTLAPEMDLNRNGEELVCGFENIPTPIVLGLPHSARLSTRFLIGIRNYDLETNDIIHGPIIVTDDDVKAEVLDESVREVVRNHEIVFEQDFVIVEHQRPEELPLDLTEELHVKTPDAAAIEYRRMLKEIGVDS